MPICKISWEEMGKNFIDFVAISGWVNNPKESTFRFDEDTLLDSLEFLLNNCYFTMGYKVFRQITEMPI